MANSRVINFGNFTKLYFLENRADIAGRSIYINLPRHCNTSFLTNSVLKTNMSNLQNYITTSRTPKQLQLYNSKFQCTDLVSDTECDLFYIQSIMLGQKILLDACMYDCYDRPVDVVRFLLVVLMIKVLIWTQTIL